MNGKIVSKRHLNESGEWEERKQFFLDGKEVTEVEFLDAFPDKSLEGGGPGGYHAAGWPMKGALALAVHESQVEIARERAKRHGISVEYNKDGSVNIPDPGNYRKLCRLEKVRNKADYN